MIKTKALAAARNERLAQCEQVIERGFSVFFDVGRALAEIRDDKLYRATHKTFEEYCKERWEIGRSRAYELIDQAKVSTALVEAGVNLSAAADISKRDARALKGNLPASAKEIKARVDKGQQIEQATKAVVDSRQSEKEKAKAARLAEQAENDKRREQTRAALPDAIKRGESYKPNGAVPGKKAAEMLPADRIAELEEAVRVLEAENATLKIENKLFAEMKVEWEKGGFAEVVAGKDEVIATLKTRVERESADKASWKRSSDMWKKRAEEAGWSNDIVIDIGEAAHG